MKIVIFGGTGFVGLNVAEVLLARGHEVTLYDRKQLPAGAERFFADHRERLSIIQGEITDIERIDALVKQGFDAIILGAAITAGDQLERTTTSSILEINVMAQMPILSVAIRRGVRRVINLSSASAYGAAGQRYPVLDEETPCDPVSFYAISKFTSERSVARLAELWGGDFLSVRLSAVFGPWEQIGKVRDTPSLQFQILAAFARGEPALLPAPGIKDWTYAPDAAEAVAVLIEAERPRHRLYNISSGAAWSALQWGEAFAALHPGLECRLASPGEKTFIKLHGGDRAPMSVKRMADEFGWRARFGCVESAAAMSAWWMQHKEGI
ncbi:NAD(P)-dependent oxidoreductase [Bradyrhizobium diazoefficiens]|uniref:Putative short chain dehydrogenase n=1 Tax=Bradyrhizobium diazoefficiens SEMIA 5080 TaxID=754504 RepID=A0A837CIM6_9BRAD|nr:MULTISPECIES: NAD(P)-dependent oxidoreductase [Bradyrhizobium]APO54617.1 short-chain dehydrogenase [Bradyrhizobium diazoefficiens]KGJ68875.1 putative short chain dehydrogenase [Bradyrhizobium diazoefficiens SEMIA 5080]KOY10266.1 short-chain dehydrogenase [Bradyrhizobium diazoefficiens]MCD9291108.1 NAD(P)-dependent oxidoreductase [Bradyrhizobium diazoefficiens]MCD9809114.1 NAD(P)-dependent oxidoreductase [Bradyrhizobium diazoefficiens]